jgi:two-component system, NarL family, nitrate/nitrite response regulator NarL
MPAKKIAELTKRENEIIALVAEGLKNKEIAERLCISSATVRHHLSAIFAKLDVRDRLKLVIFAFRQGLVDPSEKPEK